jgi:hypothetical protein
MANEDSIGGVHDEGYEEVVEFECPVCNTRVSVEAKSCPGCGAIFVSSEQKERDVLQEATAPPEAVPKAAPEAVPEAVPEAAPEADAEIDAELDAGPAAEGEEQVGYELDDGSTVPVAEGVESEVSEELDDEAIDAELAAMEADLSEPPSGPIEVDATEVEADSLELGYEDDVAAEEEVDEHFGRAESVTAEDHDALDMMSRPTLSERLFARAGMGMFLAGGALSLLVLLWDPLHGQPLSVGLMQLQFLVFCLALFIVGFAVEMLQAYSLSKHDESLAVS